MGWDGPIYATNGSQAVNAYIEDLIARDEDRFNMGLKDSFRETNRFNPKDHDGAFESTLRDYKTDFTFLVRRVTE